MCDEITYPLPNVNGTTVDVWEWISKSIQHFTGHVVTYPCWPGIKIKPYDFCGPFY